MHPRVCIFLTVPPGAQAWPLLSAVIFVFLTGIFNPAQLGVLIFSGCRILWNHQALCDTAEMSPSPGGTDMPGDSRVTPPAGFVAEHCQE